MNICVLVKQVPSSEAIIKTTRDGQWIEEADLHLTMNESDNYAIEEALQIREKQGVGEVLVVSMGPKRCQKVIREALAKGADRGIHIKEEAPYCTDPLAIAAACAAAIKGENIDLVLSGMQSDDMGFGQVGVLVGEILGMTTATLAVELAIQGQEVRVKRELESGWFQWQTMRLPASLAIQSGLNTPRYPSLRGIMSAKKKEIKELPFMPPPSEALQSFARLNTQQAEKQMEMVEGNTDQIVARLVDVLKNEIRIF